MKDPALMPRYLVQLKRPNGFSYTLSGPWAKREWAEGEAAQERRKPMLPGDEIRVVDLEEKQEE